MATFNTVVKYKRSDNLYTVYIRVTHKKKIGYIKTDKLVNKSGIAKNKSVTDPQVLKHCNGIILNYVNIINKVDISQWETKDLIKYLTEADSALCFSDYARKYHDELFINGQERNARNYELAYQHMERYAGTNKLMFTDITTGFINGWIKSLSSTSRAKEMYPVCMRQVFRKAINEFNDYEGGIIRIPVNPWQKINIPKSDTPEKKAITMEECRKFFFAPLPKSDRVYPLSELGRDVAMMILCLAGINTADIFNLKKSDLRNGIICYERAKTRKARTDNAYIEMRIPNILNPIIEKYLDKTSSPYLFNFYKRLTSEDSFNANVNTGIKKICTDSLGMNKETDKLYSAYTFRHTWGTVAQNECGASISDVGFAMNHSDKSRVTRGYVKVNFAPAWELNEKVIEKIFFTEEKTKQKEKDENDEMRYFERFSKKQFMRGKLYFRGKILASVEDIGFNNIEEIIKKLMEDLPETLPSRTMVQIRIENVDKKLKKDYTRMIR